MENFKILQSISSKMSEAGYPIVIGYRWASDTELEAYLHFSLIHEPTKMMILKDNYPMISHPMPFISEIDESDNLIFDILYVHPDNITCQISVMIHPSSQNQFNCVVMGCSIATFSRDQRNKLEDFQYTLNETLQKLSSNGE